MPLVNIELDTLEQWFTRLEDGDVERVTEAIYDEIQLIKLRLKDGQDQLEQAKLEREKEIDKIETPLTFHELQLHQNYKFISTVRFSSTGHRDLPGAEVKLISKARTKVQVQVIEPGRNATGRILKVSPQTLTTL